MDVYEIQRIVLECLRAAKVPRVLKSTIYSLSDSPGEAGVARTVKRNMLRLTVVATPEEFELFNECADRQGVYIGFRYRPFGSSDRNIYDLHAVEKR